MAETQINNSFIQLCLPNLLNILDVKDGNYFNYLVNQTKISIPRILKCLFLLNINSRDNQISNDDPNEVYSTNLSNMMNSSSNITNSSQLPYLNGIESFVSMLLQGVKTEEEQEEEVKKNQQLIDLKIDNNIIFLQNQSDSSTSTTMQTNGYLFSTGFMLLVLLYSLVLVYMAIKIKNQTRRGGKIMFGTLLLYVIIRFVTLNLCMLDSMNVIELDSYQIVYHLCMNSIFLSDCLFVIGFFALFRYFLMYKYYSHIPLTSATRNQYYFENPKWFAYPLGVFLIVQIIMVILFNTPFVDIRELMINDCIQNLLLILTYICFHVFLIFKFSGTPYQNHTIQKNARIVMIFTLFFALSRGVIVAVNIYLSDDQNGVFDLIQSPTDSLLWKEFLLMAALILTEIIPFAALVSRANLFNEQFEEPLLPNSFENDDMNLKGKQSVNMDRTESEEAHQAIIKIEDLQKAQLLQNERGEIQPLYRSNGLGKIYESCSGKAIRKIEIKQISQYILDEIQGDIAQQLELPSKRLVRILECQPCPEELILSYPFYKNNSLRTIIQKQHEVPTSIQAQEEKETFLSNQVNDNGQFTLASKINLSLQIAHIIRDLHNKGFVHGHLHPNNILLSSKLRPRISDLGLNALKKYLGLKGLYCNKSQFTSPENLMTRGHVVSTTDPSSDTYSYAFIIYEIFVGREPFSHVNYKDLKEIVVEKECRPKIPQEVPEDIQKLIRCCWYQKASDRPNFDNICEHLENYLECFQQSQKQITEHDQLKSNIRFE